MRAFLVYLLYRSFMMTWRLTLVEPPELKKSLESGQQFILAHWHGDELALLQLMGRYRIGTIVSTSKDGELMNKVAQWMGAKTSRGSSTRGAVTALKGLLRLVKEGCNCSFAVDGPKGPIYKVKPGVFEVSRMAHLPIFWAGVSCDRAFHFPRSWNKTYLPKPFAHIYVHWYGPLPPPERDADPRNPELLLDLENKLTLAKHSASIAIAEVTSDC